MWSGNKRLRGLPRFTIPVLLVLPVSVAVEAADVLIETQKLATNNYGQALGEVVEIEGNTLMATGTNFRGRGSQSDVHVIERQPDGAWEFSYLLSGNRGNDDVGSFGSSIAIDGNRLLVGDSETCSFGGGLEIYELDASGRWMRASGEICPDDESPGLGFGSSVALEGDVAVTNTRGGRTYVHVLDSGNWNQQQVLEGNGPSDMDGGIIVKGRPLGNGGTNEPGRVDVLEADATGFWRVVSTLEAPDARAGAAFGCSVAIDGILALIGACRDAEAGLDAGAVYVFQRDADGHWHQTDKLLPGETDGRLAFGDRVSLASGRALVRQEEIEPGSGSEGVPKYHVFLFAEDGSGAWAEVAELVASDGLADDQFGAYMDIDDDTAVVGAPGIWREFPYGYDLDYGSVYVYRLGDGPPRLEVNIDVQPWRADNVVDPGSPGLLGVAILGSTEFDALQADLTSLRLKPGNAPARNYRVRDVNRDRSPDLLAFFRVRDLRIGCGFTDLELTGETVVGEAFAGLDTVNNRACPAPAEDTLVLTPVAWTIGPEGGGVYSIFMIADARPLSPDGVQKLGGKLVWPEVKINLCSDSSYPSVVWGSGISIRGTGAGYVRIGDGFQSDRQTDDCAINAAMQEAFDRYGLPKKACLWVKTGGERYRYCAPLEQSR